MLRKIARGRPRPIVVAVAAVTALAGVVGVGVVGVGVVGVAGPRGDDGPETAVRAFFDARRDGDCERLRDLVSETSWSRGDQLDRAGFVEECDEVVDVYGPRFGDVEVVRIDGDGNSDGERAVVAVSVEVDQDAALGPGAGDGLLVHGDPGDLDTAHTTGTLVREQGRWKVETDLGLLRIGPSPNEALTAYLEARARARCDDVADLLSEDAWAAAGATDRAGFVERCEATTVPDEALWLVPTALRFELADHDGRIAAVSSDETRFGSGTSTGSNGETITLVADGLGWRLDRDLAAITARGIRGLVVDPPIEGYEADLGDLLVPGTGTPVPLVEEEGTDAVERRSEAGFEGGATVRFSGGDNYLTVLLYRFGTPEGAAAYAGDLARRAAANTDRRAAPATPGVPFRTVLDCGNDDCSGAEVALALDTHDRYLVAIEVVDFIDPDRTTADLLDHATALVDTQLAAL